KNILITLKFKQMRNHAKELEEIASDILDQNADAVGGEAKPNYTNRDFINALIIFQHALMDKMYDLQVAERMSFDDMCKMANNCGVDLGKLIFTYTGLDVRDVENFL